MTQRFILDENIVIYAQLGQNERGDKDTTCAELIGQIIRICHTIVADPNLWNKYQSQLNRPRHNEPQIGSVLLRVLRNASQRDGKLDIKHNDAPSFPEEANIPQGSQDDVHIVRLVVETGATLVTTDDALKNELNSCGVQETYNLQILSPAEALQQL